MTTPSSGEGGTGTESQSVVVVPVLGSCIWCGHALRYANPGSPPGDCMTDGQHFYRVANVWRDFSLIDEPLVYGKVCPLAPPSPLGQYPVHQLVIDIGVT